MQNTDTNETIDISVLSEHFSGTLILPGMEGYDKASKVLNATGAPVLIAQCVDVEDVRAAVSFARDNGYVLSVRSGGHSFSGDSTNNGGIVIDLARMNHIELIDKANDVVRVEGGANWGQVATYLSQFNLALTAGDTASVGVGGLTLGGGIGWMVRKYGLTIDNMLAATVVTADGNTVRASADEHADLFWAIRGGDGNFGVVTSFEFQAQRVAGIYTGKIIYDAAEMQKILAGWSHYMKTAPEELTSTATILPPQGPDNPPAVSIEVCYAGSDEQTAMQAINPLLQLGTVVRQTIAPSTYTDFLVNQPVRPPLPNFVKLLGRNEFIKTLTDEIIQTMSASYGKPGAPMLQLRSLGGAVSRIDEMATAFSRRNDDILAVTMAVAWEKVPEAVALQQIDTAWKPLEKFATGMYVSFFDGSTEDTSLIYPAQTHERLLAVKKIYDPENLFNQNCNIK